MISWNCRGVPLRGAARVLERLEHEFFWDILCLQEFTDKDILTPEIAGHAVILGPPSGRRKRRPCIVVHKTLTACIIGKPVYRDACLAVVVITPHGGKLWVLCAHLDPDSNNHSACAQDLQYCEQLLLLAPPHFDQFLAWMPTPLSDHGHRRGS